MDRRCRTLVTEQRPALQPSDLSQLDEQELSNAGLDGLPYPNRAEAPSRRSGAVWQHEGVGTYAATSEVDVRFCKVTKGATATA